MSQTAGPTRFIGKIVLCDKRSREPTNESYYIVVTFAPSGEPCMRSLPLKTFEALIGFIKEHERTDGPFGKGKIVFETPTGIHWFDNQPVRYEALSYEEFNAAQVRLGRV